MSADALHHEPLDAAAAALSVRSLSIDFGGIKALVDVSFDVPASGVTAVIGPNGAGKTTLFNCVSGFYRGEGEIHVAGTRIDGLAPHARTALGIARTFQTPALVDGDSLLENVLVGRYGRTSAGMLASFTGLPQVRREERGARELACELVERLGLGPGAHVDVAQLPHRQRQLTEIARALLSEPRLLLLDEPAAGSQHGEAVEMLGMVSELCAERDIAVVLVEHNVQLVMQFSQRVVVLDFGEVIAQGSPAEVQRHPRVRQAYLGEVAV